MTKTVKQPQIRTGREVMFAPMKCIEGWDAITVPEDQLEEYLNRAEGIEGAYRTTSKGDGILVNENLYPADRVTGYLTRRGDVILVVRHDLRIALQEREEREYKGLHEVKRRDDPTKNALTLTRGPGPQVE